MTSELLRAVSTHADAVPHLTQLLATSRRHGLSAPQTAYVLALAHHESRLGLRLVDPASGWAFEGRAELGNTEEGDGPRFRGRGYVPIVGRRAYSQWAHHLSLPLVDHPELVQTPEVAADILVQGVTYGRFTGRSLPEFVNDARADYVGARRTVPRRDRAGVVAGYARSFASALRRELPPTPAKPQVRDIQRWLRSCGWPVGADGILGSMTRRAVEDFQAGYALEDPAGQGLAVGAWPDQATVDALRTSAAAGGLASAHFRFREFRAPGGPHLTLTNHAIRVDRRLLVALERYRQAVGQPVRVAVGYRPPSDPVHACTGPIAGLVAPPTHPLAQAAGEHRAGLAVDVADPVLSGEEAAALGLFATIGTRRGLAVHLGIASAHDGPDANLPLSGGGPPATRLFALG